MPEIHDPQRRDDRRPIDLRLCPRTVKTLVLRFAANGEEHNQAPYVAVFAFFGSRTKRSAFRRVREAVLVTTQKSQKHRPQRSLGKRRQTKGPQNVPCALGAARGSHARWWVARSMRSMGRNNDRGFVGVGGLVYNGPTASLHPTKTSATYPWVMSKNCLKRK